ncbi:MAG: hypothetical protein Q4E99_05980, partial [Bacillota bacterium]|nr:hypothetical protein [Bacillota bacterium]
MERCFSKTLYKENLKRFWTIPVVAFLFYFVSGLFTLCMHYDREYYSYYEVHTMLSNQNFGFLVVECGIPVVIAIALFSYLNKANSVNLIHALPYTRRQLYISNLLSGITLSTIPQIITAILLVILRKPTEHSYIEQRLVLDYEVFTISNIAFWLLMAFTVSFFVLCVCTFACMLCGNGIIAFLTGCGLNLIVPVIVLCFEGYAENMYFGFDDGSFFDDVLMNFHPATKLVFNPTVINCLVFIAIGLIIAVLSYLLYGQRKLEKCTDGYVFELAKHFFGFMFVFVFTTGFGL